MGNASAPVPHFTAPDPELLRGESTRDPLGLVPVWSKVGHQLVPGLATIVDRIDGIQGVLFLYTCLGGLPEKTRDKRPDKEILLFLERLWEYHLYVYRDRRPCFGLHRLGGADFQLNFDGPGSVGTGLRQYYRGTCIKKGLLADDQKTLGAPYQKICQGLLAPAFLKRLGELVGQSAPRRDSFSAGQIYDEFGGNLQRFSKACPELWLQLKKDLLDDCGQLVWIEDVMEKLPNWDDDSCSTRELVENIQAFAKTLRDRPEWVDSCQNILACEPFLQTLETAFAILQKETRAQLADVASDLQRRAPDNLAAVCRDFSGIRLRESSSRLACLQKELVPLLETGDYRGFIETLVAHYHRICAERGKAPALHLDVDSLLSASAMDADIDWSQSSRRWRNEYFIKTQLRLYQDWRTQQGGFDA